MTIEELRAEAKKLGYNLIPINKKKNFFHARVDVKDENIGAFVMIEPVNGRQNLNAINAVKPFAGLQKKKLSIIGTK